MSNVIKVEQNFLDCLPFVGRDLREAGHPRNFWDVSPSGDYAADCETGRMYAEDCLAYMRVNASPILLKSIVMAMPREFSGIEIGFLHVLGSAAVGPREDDQREYSPC